MTENKRFYVAESNIIDGYCVFDKTKKYAFVPRDKKVDCLSDCDVLNKLSCEADFFKTEFRQFAIASDNREKQLINENEYLQERNDRQRERLDNLYQLILNRDYDGQEELIKELEESERLLQEEMKLYCM